MTLQEKLEIVDRNARTRGRAEVAITRQRLQDLKLEMAQREAAIAEQFDLECWRGFAAEFTEEEIAGMAAHEGHRKHYRRTGV